MTIEPMRRRALGALLAAALLAAPAAARAQTIGLSSATIADLNRAFDSGALTSEALVQMYLDRIQAYDQQGPALNAILFVNPKALEQARALDAERKQKGPRSPLHGIPVILKDNIDTGDMPTTGGSLILKGSIPPDDAFFVKKLRDAGAIVLGKANLSELASGATMSSMHGPMKNPHDLARTPSGSSGGSGVGIAAAFAQIGFGTDTGGSVRGPSTSNGVVGLKPTHGLISHDGIIPLSLTFDMAGPMARSVADIAAVLNVVAKQDPADASTRKSEGHVPADYTKSLDPSALKGARIGVARQFMGRDADVDFVMEAALQTMRAQGATIVDVKYPAWLLQAKEEWYTTIRWPDFRAQIKDYLATLKPGYPKNLEEMIAASEKLYSTTPEGGVPNPARWNLFKQEQASGELTDYKYEAMRDYGLPMARAIVEGMLEAQNLDAIVYPTSSTRPELIAGGAGGGGGPSGTNLANITGFPDLIVPAGFSGDRLPIGISFIGAAFSEPRLLGLGYAFEQATHARRDPVMAPPLAKDRIKVPAASATDQR